jgi:hypothetical protein
LAPDEIDCNLLSTKKREEKKRERERENKIHREREREREERRTTERERGEWELKPNLMKNENFRGISQLGLLDSSRIVRELFTCPVPYAHLKYDLYLS